MYAPEACLLLTLFPELALYHRKFWSTFSISLLLLLMDFNLPVLPSTVTWYFCNFHTISFNYPIVEISFKIDLVIFSWNNYNNSKRTSVRSWNVGLSLLLAINQRICYYYNFKIVILSSYRIHIVYLLGQIVQLESIQFSIRFLI